MNGDAHSMPMGALMSPAQAAQLLKMSRRTIMRAIESHELLAVRDNRNHWKIALEELDRWAGAQCAPSGHVHPEAPTLPTYQDSPETLAKLAAETARADAAERARNQAEADRDAWRRQAEKLADRPQQRDWWPWRKK